MLHELLLLLSGNPSPLLTPGGLPTSFPLVSRSERALLESLAKLGHLHISLRRACVVITASHPSTIARAVASAIDTHHLQSFRARILAVEESILKREAGVVGGYDSVSLAKVLSGFEGWDRTLCYLINLVETILVGSTVEKKPAEAVHGEAMTGGALIDRLRGDIYTGYPVLEAVSFQLLKVAETAWLREASTWVLYGCLPTHFVGGMNRPSTDFFISEVLLENLSDKKDTETDRKKDYVQNRKLLPSFVTAQAADSILFIGRALAIVRLRGASAAASSTIVAYPEMTLLPLHLSYLQSLESPLTPQKLSRVISDIRLSLSKHTLQTLLPVSRILESVHVLREFFLLGRGEFAVALIRESSDEARSRFKKPKAASLKEGEVSAILTRTWGVLSMMQSEEVVDDRLDAARDLISLSTYKPAVHTPALRNKVAVAFIDLLVGVPISLNFSLSWPLELFLQPADLDTYDEVFAYLIAVRKTQSRLQGIWKCRRYPPPPSYLTRDGHAARGRRQAVTAREIKQRPIWAAAALAVFFLETITEFWQGEVIETAFKSLIGIIEPPEEGSDLLDNDGDIWMEAFTPDPTRMGIARPEQHRDPESLTRAHHAYLRTLKQGLFLSDHCFPSVIKQFLLACEDMAGTMEGMVLANKLSDVETVTEKNEERELVALHSKCDNVKALLKSLVSRLQTIDEERKGDWEDVVVEGEEVKGRDPTKVDQLLMKLDLESFGV